MRLLPERVRYLEKLMPALTRPSTAGPCRNPVSEAQRHRADWPRGSAGGWQQLAEGEAEGVRELR